MNQRDIANRDEEGRPLRYKEEIPMAVQIGEQNR